MARYLSGLYGQHSSQLGSGCPTRFSTGSAGYVGLCGDGPTSPPEQFPPAWLIWYLMSCRSMLVPSFTPAWSGVTLRSGTRTLQRFEAKSCEASSPRVLTFHPLGS
ncbi:hypothetical protein SESBI_21066 [Sesbania bispinosa]|nr:hypothetical protein SESBI_21066 [Sesbania bispinosa]